MYFSSAIFLRGKSDGKLSVITDNPSHLTQSYRWDDYTTVPVEVVYQNRDAGFNQKNLNYNQTE